MIKTGIFGGAFNPVHNGHVNLAKEAIEQLKLRKLLIVPTFESPHKDTRLLPFDERAEMCRLAFSGISDKCEVEISDIEREMGGVSYTINTIRALAKRCPDAQFYLLIGGDMLFSFEKWYKYESILKESKVVAVARGGDNFTDMLEFAAEMGRVKVLPTAVVDVSSTEVRERLAEGRDVSELVPRSVAGYIAANDLYRGQKVE
ncbi:MAG: nicotinate (nicotinamide) nucleotide adenylyltransferase [Lachnospiraceae bacterium]|nr:nicotinate (nicotinamide) nucleotide adenylyltransferase [Ruminococcus sp.]MCM1274625.1 nicotinate (nicotinamide) nucleotide adenylyltransferase [Lachnospiraceae bacterium]